VKTEKTISQGAETEGNEINSFRNYLENLFMTDKPLAKLFKTDNHLYLYDTGSNKIIACDEPVFTLLEMLFSMEPNSAIQNYLEKYNIERFIHAASSIKNAVETENIFSLKKALPFGMSKYCLNHKELIDNSLELMVLEVTEKCNFQCEYCVYKSSYKDKRNHGLHDMPASTAIRAAEYLKQHSLKRDKVSITFYGGEPLLNFSLIKDTVEYAEKIFKEKRVSFSITTNASLITKEIACFLLSHDFNVLVSIDGPRDIHDSFRLGPGGEGTFNKTIGGLKVLADVFGAPAKNKIGLSIVYTPPFSGDRLDRVAELWSEIPWLPDEINLNITYPTPGTIPNEVIKKAALEEDKNLQQWAFERYKRKYVGEGVSHPIANAVIEKTLAQLIQRPIFSKSQNHNFLTGCCIPGVRRIYVTTDGNFHLCERISTFAPVIGNIKNGIDLDSINKYYFDQYESMCTPNCTSCWAIRLCSSCYIDAFLEGKLSSQFLRNHCDITRESKERFLQYTMDLLEFNPNGLNYLYDYIIT